MSESKSSKKLKGEVALNQAKSELIPGVISFVISMSSDDLMCQVACAVGNECGQQAKTK